MADFAEILAVHRCTDMVRGPLATGTIQCSLCKAECWIAQSSINLISKIPAITVMCMRCVADQPDGSITEVRAVPGAMREINDLLSDPKYAATRDILNRKRSR